MFDTLTTDLGSRFLIAAGGVAVGLVLLVIILMVLRRRNAPLFVRGGKSREPRLAVLDAAAVDTRRRLVLIRRDDIEHLIMIGGPTDIVIESGIGLAQPQMQPQVNMAPAATPTRNIADKVAIREADVAAPVINQTRTAPAVAADPAPTRVEEPARVEPAVAAPVRAVERLEPAIIPPAANAIPAAAIIQPVVAQPVIARPAPVAQPNPVAEMPVQPQVQPARASETPLQPVSSATQALYRDTTADEEEKVLADMLTRAQENRAAANAQATTTPAATPAVTPQAPQRAAMQPQANPVQPAGLAHGQINRRIEPDLGRKDDSAEDILEAARNRVLASRPAEPASEQRQQAGGRIEPGFANPAMGAARPVTPTVIPVVQPSIEPANLPSREDLASEFEKILEAEMAANGIQLDAPVVAAPVVQNQANIPNPVRPANLPPVTGASPDNALEREMQRLLAERGLDRSGRA